MKSFSFENMKSFKNTGNINIKPITIFVGKNSCGKSNLIRFPAVLSQTSDDMDTIEFKGRYVDYGYFEDIIFNHSGNQFTYTLTFEAKELMEFLEKDSLGNNEFRFIKQFLLSKQDISASITLSKEDTSIYIEEFTLLIDSSKVMNIKKEKESYRHEIVNMGIDDLVPEELFCFEDTVQFKRGIPQLNYHLQKVGNEIYRQIVQCLSNKDDQIELIDENVLEITGEPEEEHDIDHDDYELNEDSLNESEYVEIVTGRNTDYEEEVQEKKKRIFLITTKIKTSIITFSVICSLLSKLINRFTNSITYLGPFRESPMREYKDKESTVDYVGKSGENTGAILKQSKSTLDKVTEWFCKTLNLNIKIEEFEDNNQFRIMVYSDDNNGENLADVGFGISQLLPIITQIHYDKNDNHNQGKIFIIEQPEIHLHPCAQADLADLFINRILDNNKDIILIETHSEHLIRKIQVLIADPDINISPDDIAIYYIDKTSDNDSSVLNINLNQNGQFRETWPKGFFDKSYELSMDLLRSARKRGKV